MKLHKNLLIGAVSALAISALPFSVESMASGSFALSSAYAKGGNGGGNGGGHGGGHGGGQGGGHSSQGGSGAHGKSANAGGNGKSGNVRTSPRQDRQLAAIGKQTRAEKRQIRVDDVKTARATAKSLREREVATLPDTVFVPTAKPEDKNLHARLAGLNSLQRNYHAYLNSQSPRMAGIAAYVMASAQLALAQVPSEELLAATDDEALRQALLDAANKNRVAQYGEDYIDEDIMGWAKDVLGVGDAFGKIDEVQDTLEQDALEQDTLEQDTLEVDSQ